MIDDAMNVQPLRAHPIAIKSFLQIVRIFFLHLISVATSVFQRWWFIHVNTSYIVAI